MLPRRLIPPILVGTALLSVAGRAEERSAEKPAAAVATFADVNAHGAAASTVAAFPELDSSSAHAVATAPPAVVLPAVASFADVEPEPPADASLTLLATNPYAELLASSYWELEAPRLSSYSDVVLIENPYSDVVLIENPYSDVVLLENPYSDVLALQNRPRRRP